MTAPVTQGEDAERGVTTPGSDDDVSSSGYWTPNEKDMFEVAFDGGDADPMSPRSMTKARKWLIVAVLASAGLCL